MLAQNLYRGPQASPERASGCTPWRSASTRSPRSIPRRPAPRPRSCSRAHRPWSNGSRPPRRAGPGGRRPGPRDSAARRGRAARGARAARFRRSRPGHRAGRRRDPAGAPGRDRARQPLAGAALRGPRQRAPAHRDAWHASPTGARRRRRPRRRAAVRRLEHRGRRRRDARTGRRGRYRLQGAKTFASGAGVVARAIVTGRLPDGGWQMCLVPMDRVAARSTPPGGGRSACTARPASRSTSAASRSARMR